MDRRAGIRPRRAVGARVGIIWVARHERSEGRGAQTTPFAVLGDVPPPEFAVGPHDPTVNRQVMVASWRLNTLQARRGRKLLYIQTLGNRCRNEAFDTHQETTASRDFAVWCVPLFIRPIRSRACGRDSTSGRCRGQLLAARYPRRHHHVAVGLPHASRLAVRHPRLWFLYVRVRLLPSSVARKFPRIHNRRGYRHDSRLRLRQALAT